MLALPTTIFCFPAVILLRIIASSPVTSLNACSWVLKNLIVLEFTTFTKYSVLSANIPRSLVALPVGALVWPIDALPFVLYMTLSPVFKLWRPLNANNVKSSSEFPIPNWSVVENGCALNGISLDLFPMIGSKTAPDPFPPVTPIDTTLSISKVRGSIKTSTTLPFTQGWANAPDPEPSLITILGGLITSYSLPPDNTFNLVKGPKYILSFDL